MRTRTRIGILLMTACFVALATGPAVAGHASRSTLLAGNDALLAVALGAGDDDDEYGRNVRVLEGDDTRCVTERRVYPSSYNMRTVCVSPPPDEGVLERNIRSSSSGQSGILEGPRTRSDLGFSLIA